MVGQCGRMKKQQVEFGWGWLAEPTQTKTQTKAIPIRLYTIYLCMIVKFNIKLNENRLYSGKTNFFK